MNKIWNNFTGVMRFSENMYLYNILISHNLSQIGFYSMEQQKEVEAWRNPLGIEPLLIYLGGKRMKRKIFLPLVVLLSIVCLLLPPIIASASTAASITFTSPISTDVLMVGSSVTTNWTWKGNPGPLQLTLVDNDGFVKGYIANNVTKGSGITNIRFTVPVKDDYNWYSRHKIVARTMDGNKFVAQSASFKIRAPEITVTLPSAGFVWPAGSLSTIKWSSEIATGIGKIELVRDNQVVQAVSPSVPINQGSLSWKLPKALPSSYDNKYFVIRVWNLTVGTWGDSAPFKIVLK